MLELFQDVCNRFGPHERLRVLVTEPNELVDCGDQVWHAREDPSANALARNLTEPPLNEIQPRGTRRGKMQMKSGMFCQPLFDIGMGVGPVIVQDQVQNHLARRVSVDGAQELQELLVAMAWVTGPDHCAVEHIERREQAGGAMALIVMRHGAASPLLHRQARLCPI